MITLVAVSNPFQPAISRTVYEVEWHEGMTLAEVMESAGVPVLRHACVIDGLVVPEEILAGYLIADGVTVVCMPNVGGGGFGKMFAEIAVMAAAAAVTGGLGALALASLATTVGATMVSVGTLSALAGAAIALGGNMLISAFMGGGGGGGATSNSFNPTGPKTISSGGTPIPKGYGKYLSGGNIIASYVTAEGLNDYVNVEVSYGWGPAVAITDLTINHNTVASYAGITYMTRLGTNNQRTIPNFNNIVNGYPQEIRAVALAGTIKTGANPGTPIIIQGTGTQTQGLSVVMQFPNGVFYSNDDGSLRSLSVAYQVQYSISGQNNWQNPIIPDPAQTHDLITYAYDGTVSYAPGWVVIPTDGNYSSGLVYSHDNNKSLSAHTPGDPWSATQTVTYYNADGSSYQGPITLTGEWQVCDATLNQQIVYGWMAGYVIFTDSNQGTLYHTTSIFNLPPNKYDVRVTKFGCAFAGDPIIAREANNSRTGDQTWVYSVSEIEYQDLAYPNMILCGVRAMSTGQVSGANINIGALVQYDISVTLPQGLAAFSHDNPAVVAYDMLVAPFYGGGVSPSVIDVPSFVAWAQYNDQLVSDGFTGTIKRHVFNGIFEAQGTNLWKSVQKVAMMAQASIVQIGRNYSVVVDMPVTVPAQVFTSANVLKDSIKDTWLSFDDRANRIEVTFADAARNYRTDEPCAVMLPRDIQAGVEAKTTRVQLLGCTNRAQAWHWAYRKLLATDLLLLTRSFDVGIEAVACQVGSVIGVQDDVTQWCFGGRIQTGSTSTGLVVDVPDLTYVNGAGWTVSVVHPIVTVGTGVISSVVGNLVTFSSATATNAAVQSFENGTGGVAVIQAVGMVGGLVSTATVANAAGFVAGQTVSFYMQDVVDTQPVSAYGGNVLTPYAPFIQAPSPDSPWVYGQSAGAFPAGLFTVTNIRKKGDLQVTLDCLEYNAAVYADDTPIITDTLGIPQVIAAVTKVTAVEQYVMANGSNGGQASNISVGWLPGPSTRAAQIWVARNEPNQPLSAETLVQTVSGAPTCTLVYPTGSILQIRVVGVDGLGHPAPFATAPKVTITVQGSGLAPGDVPSFTGYLTPTNTVLQWTAAASATAYEVRYNADIANADWQAASLVYSGAALNWTDTIPRQGLYLIKALSVADVESIHAASWNYLNGPSRMNLVPLAAGQSPVVTVSSNVAVGTTATVTINFPAQVLFRQDGSPFNLASSSVTFPGLVQGTAYIIYAYLDQVNYVIHSGAGDTSAPDTAANPAHAAVCSTGMNYPGPVINVTAASTGSSGSGSTATFSVQTDRFANSSGYYNVTGITVISGGSSYTTPTGNLKGYAVLNGVASATTVPLTFTVVGGAITDVQGGADGTTWTNPPHVVMN